MDGRPFRKAIEGTFPLGKAWTAKQSASGNDNADAVGASSSITSISFVGKDFKSFSKTLGQRTPDTEYATGYEKAFLTRQCKYKDANHGNASLVSEPRSVAARAAWPGAEPR